MKNFRWSLFSKKEKWTKKEIHQWLLDVYILWDEINEKGESEGKSQLSYLIEELKKEIK